MLAQIVRRAHHIYKRARWALARRRQKITITSVLASRGAGERYKPWQTVAAVVQHFNKRDNILPIFSALEASGLEEIIYIDDGSVDGSLAELTTLATGPNHFVIRSNDIFEVRTYNRAVRFAQADLVVLLQDDDIPPANEDWVSAAVAAFDARPKLAILGGRDGLTLSLSKCGSEIEYTAQRLHSSRDPILFCDVVNRAPMFVRRSFFEEVGGIDQIFAPFQCDDVDLCLRAWLSGNEVALYATDFVRDVGVGGMRLFNAGSVTMQSSKNWDIIKDRYGHLIADGWVRDKVAAANASCGVSTRSQRDGVDVHARKNLVTKSV